MKAIALSSIRQSRATSRLCLITALLLLFQVVWPVSGYAIANQASPEFASFEPVATTDMVNDFTGEFTFNKPVLEIPGPDGGGYALSLSYHSGMSSEEEASWVGAGWTLNAGSIMRMKRGLPDDFNGVPVTKFNKLKPNWTQNSTFSFNMEYNSVDEGSRSKKDKGESPKSIQEFFKLFKAADFELNPLGLNPDEDDEGNGENIVSVSLSRTARFNNNSGFSIANGFGVGVKGVLNLNMTRAGGENTYGFSVNPIALLRFFDVGLMEKKKNKIWNKEILKKNRVNLKQFRELQDKIPQRAAKYRYLGMFSSSYNSWSFNAPAVPFSVAYNVGKAFNFSGSVQGNPYGPIGLQIGVAGSFNAQINIPKTEVDGYGYMYNPNYTNQYEDLEGLSFFDITTKIPEADFHIEKGSPFNKHDKNLGIPFNNADLFLVSGNNAGGGFRLHHQQLGHYYPTPVTNNQKIANLGVEVGIGGTIQIGLDLGLGNQKMTTTQWSASPGSYAEFPDVNSPNTVLPYMRFMNDPGGSVLYSGTDDVDRATVGSGLQERNVDLSDLQGKELLQTDKSGESSYIEYEVFDDGGQITPNLDPSISLPSGSQYANQIAQIAVTNQEGGRSVYGLPVYNLNEKELTIGLDETDDGWNKYRTHKTLHYGNPLKNKTVYGQSIDTPYAMAYLLTSNTTVNYLDVNANGPDEADFGGWTKFHYRKAYGPNGNISSSGYRYRMPYTGLLYERGRLFDLKDQMGSMSSGEKEVYYLSCVETKTHFAVFVTSDMTPNELSDILHNRSPSLSVAEAIQMANKLLDQVGQRQDGYDAAAWDSSSGEDPAAADPNQQGMHHLGKLDKIVLFAKADARKPLSTTYFEYDYSLCKNLPNNKSGNYNTSGKLTLRKLWTEAEGAMKSRVAPYQFFYEYFTDYPQPILQKYPALLDGIQNLSASDQNPNYLVDMLDVWGNYQMNAEQRTRNMLPWVSQKPSPNNFDPAAWSLKRIVLPTGAEIHVQYEQKQYRYVEQERATAMVSLLDHADMNNSYKSYDAEYVINTDDIGVAPTEVDAYIDSLRQYFIAESKKLYFRALYGYVGVPNALLGTTKLNRTDYITGYTTVNEVGKTPDNKIYLRLGETGDNNDPKKDRTLPRWVCYEKLLTAAGKNLGISTDKWDEWDEEICSEAYAGAEDGVYTKQESDDAINEIKKGKAVAGTFTMFGNWISGKVANEPRNKACKELKPELSYFKLPLLHAKKGGGVRVKRLLMYDPGILGETGDAMVYGSEYLYEMEDGKDSGVATNEPVQAREENPLVFPLERVPQKKLNKLLNGRDSKEFEGPLGENLYPSATVVHERIIIQNIHTGRTASGFQVNQYHTVHTYPAVKVEYSDLNKDDGTYKKYNLSLPLGLLNFNTQKAWLTQGYRFLISDMHGRLASQATYPGNYDRLSFQSSWHASLTTYHYSQPGVSINTLVYDPDNNAFKVEALPLGKEEDLTLYSSKVNDNANDFSLELDLNINLPCAITLGFAPSFDFSRMELCQHVISKVIWQKSYLIATTSTVDGVAQTTQNIMFNKYNGDPVLTQTYDGFYDPQKPIYTEYAIDGPEHTGTYYSLNFPASWIYEAMGQKAANYGNRNQLTASAGNIIGYGLNPFENITSWNSPIFDQVVSATATIYKNNWFGAGTQTALAPYLNGASSNVIQALNEFYYPLRSYQYRSDVSDANANNQRIYTGGIFDQLNTFRWDTVTGLFPVSAGWFSPSNVSLYSPHGFPIEEVDALGIRSAARFGYGNTLPVLVVANAEAKSVLFADYEYPPPTIGATWMPGVNTSAHSGKYAWTLPTGSTPLMLKNLVLTDDLKKKGASLRFWLKSQLSAQTGSPDWGLKNPAPNCTVLLNNQSFLCKSIAQCGEWTLYETSISDWGTLQVNDLFDLHLQYNRMANESVWIDDVRWQPVDAQMTCSVYYPDFKLAAQFDDQHFATFYLYNSQGQLVRKSIETERGEKVVQEQQYNIPLYPR